MRKLFFMLIFLFVLYLAIQFSFVYFGKGEDYSYEVEHDGLVFGVNETSTFRLEDNYDNYYFNIHVNDTVFNFQTNYDFNKLTQVIDDIEYFKNNNYECILPVYKGNITLSDFICYSNNEYTYYYNLVGKDNDLDRYVNSVATYSRNKFIDNGQMESIEGVNVAKNNLIKNHYIGFTNYRGIYNVSANFNSTVYDIELYSQDERNQKVGVFLNQYYVSADYNQEYEFNKFNVVDLVKLDTFDIISNNEISLDSYIQGTLDNKIYLYDKDSKIQHEIDINNKSSVELSQSTIKYYNGEWSTMTIAEANSELKFNKGTIDYTNNEFVRIDKIGNITGYYYVYKKIGNEYNAYRMNIQDKDKLTYLFTTKTIDNIYYVDNYVYYVNGSDVYLYYDMLGIQKIINYNELEFNQNINFHVYAK